MLDLDILKKIKTNFHNEICDIYPFPKFHKGEGKIKAIILGADPTHIVRDEPEHFEKVFGLEQKEKSPYWRSIQRNLVELNLTMEYIFVQNLCRNYFWKETSKNKQWEKIARDYWAPFLRDELNKMFSSDVPILMTTEFILHSILTDSNRKMKAKTIYEENIIIPKEENLLGRELIAFYRHYKYSLALPEWKDYKGFINNRIYSRD